MSVSPPLKSSLHATGGNPTGLPDYRPINKLPKHEIEELLVQQLKPALYQVVVETRNGNSLRVGPKCSSQTATAFASAIQEQIALGRETRWSNPSVAIVI